jgi:hypothetical protein
VDWLVEANLSEKRAVFTFRAKVIFISLYFITSVLKRETACLSETLAFANQITR